MSTIIVSQGNTHLLPDSRLQDRDQGTVMMDWELLGGGIMRLEMSPVFCGNCGVLSRYVPKENTSFAFYLCGKCFRTYGAIAGTFALPDDEFDRAVQHEMETRFGRALTD